MSQGKTVERSEKEWKAYGHWATHPVEAVKAWFNVTPDDWQGDALQGLFNEQDRLAYKSAHGTGKTTLDAWTGWIFLNCFKNSRVVATAPTIHQLSDALWPEYAKWHDKMPTRMRNEWVISGTHIRHRDTEKSQYSSMWFAVARTSNKPANLQGFHNEHLLIQGDEGSAIPDPVFEVIEGALSEAGDEGKTAKLQLGGNPNFTTGELFNAFGRNRELYHRITITGDPEWFASLSTDDKPFKSGDYHPDHGRVYLSARVKPRYVENMAKKYGRDSAIFDVRVRGIFPRNADDVVIPWSWAQHAMTLDIPTVFDQYADPVTIVVDPSRGGGASTVIGCFRQGYCVRLNSHKVTSTTTIVNLVNEIVLELISKGINLNEIIVDEPGIGGGVIDQLRAKNLPVKPYNGGWGLVQGIDPADDCRQFANRRARDWWNLRRKIERGYPLPYDDELLGQLTSLKFKYNPSEKILCESKEDLKSRLGKEASPDKADVLVMGCAPWYFKDVSRSNITAKDIITGADRPSMPDFA